MENKTSQTPVRSTSVAITLLTCVPLLMVLGNSVLIPGMPEMESRMHVTKFQVSLIITLFSVPAGIVIPFAGFLSDRLSRKWIVVPSLLVFGAGGVLAGCAAWWIPRPYTIVLIGRVIQGIGAAGTAPIAMAWMGDLFTGSQRSRALGIHEAGNAFGKVISPILGSVITLIAWFSVFFLFPILCLPVAACIWWFLPDKVPGKQAQSVGEYVQSLGQIVKREGRWLSIAYLAGATTLFTLFGVLFYLSDLLEKKYHIDGVPKGLVLAIPLLVLVSTSLIVGSTIQKRKPLMKWLMVIGFTILCLSLFVSTWLATNAWLLVGLMSCAAIGTGFTLPCLNMLVTSAVSTEKRGIVTSFYGSVRFLGVAAGPPVFTWLLSKSTQWMFISVAALSAACGLLVLWLIRPEGELGQPMRKPLEVNKWPGRHRART